MSAPAHCRPFDLDAAKEGAPYGLLSGDAVTILKWDARKPDFPIMAIFGEEDTPSFWRSNGKSSLLMNSHRDLVMLPLGLIDGKPVYFGDEVCDPHRNNAKADLNMEFSGYWKWPAPPKVYLETDLSPNGIVSAYYNGGPVIGSQQEVEGFYRIANAALRHAIDTGQVFTASDVADKVKQAYVDGQSATYRDQEADREKRDMAVAQVVRNMARNGFAGAQSYISNTTAYRWVSNLNLTAIIASLDRPGTGEGA